MVYPGAVFCGGSASIPPVFLDVASPLKSACSADGLRSCTSPPREVSAPELVVTFKGGRDIQAVPGQHPG